MTTKKLEINKQKQTLLRR